MLYTENISLRDCYGFLQMSHIFSLTDHDLISKSFDFVWLHEQEV